MDPKIIAKHGIKSAIITAAIPWVEDLLAQVENPDPCLLEGLDTLRRRLAGERCRWRDVYSSLGALCGPVWSPAVDSPRIRAAHVLKALLMAEADSGGLIYALTQAWLAYTGQSEPVEG